jgi:hypothetical protein
MSSTKRSGSSLASSWRRNVICGWVAATTIGAAISSPEARATPRTRSCVTRIRSTGASRRISAPKDRALPSNAAATAPMPPTTVAHAPT